MAETKLKPLTLDEFRRQRKPLRNVNKQFSEDISPMNRFAMWITDHIGTMGFFLLIFTWTVIWLGWNMLGPVPLRFDPAPAFVCWLFISNLIQIMLMPLIMVGQNLQAKHAELRAEYDLDVNVKAEHEIEVILQHLEYQNAMLIRMLENMGIHIDEALGKAKKK